MALRKEADPFETARSAQEVASTKRSMIKRYGEVLGTALLEYTKEGLSEQKLKNVRGALSEVLVTVLETGTHEEKVKALSALLEAFEARIAPVAEMAHEAHISSSVY